MLASKDSAVQHVLQLLVFMYCFFSYVSHSLSQHSIEVHNPGLMPVRVKNCWLMLIKGLFMISLSMACSGGGVQSSPILLLLTLGELVPRLQIYALALWRSSLFP